MSTLRRLPALLGIAAAAGLALTALAGLSACTVTRTSTLVDGFTRNEQVTEVRLDHSGSGDVSVQADSSVVGVDVRRTVHYGDSKPGPTTRFEGNTLVLDMDCGFLCDVSYVVRVPNAVAVNGSNSSGDINLHGVSTVDVHVSSGNVIVDGASGAVNVRASSGDVTLANITGSVMVHVTSGDIRARGLSGTTDQLETTSGDIEATLAAPSTVVAKVTSGDITLRVPDGSYHVTAHASSGDTDIQIATDPAGTNTLDLTAGSGDITVAKA